MIGRDWYISVQTLAELYQWAKIRHWGKRRWARLISWVSRCTVLDADPDTAYLWAHVCVIRRQIGQPISAQDAWVAACALRHKYPLLTNNVTDLVVVKW